ncbi:hypothetical protein AK812_SmicGene47528, partial [Symbiodinium microadriaticum]
VACGTSRLFWAAPFKAVDGEQKLFGVANVFKRPRASGGFG